MDNLLENERDNRTLRDKEIAAVISELNKTIMGLSQLLKSLNGLLTAQNADQKQPKQLH